MGRRGEGQARFTTGLQPPPLTSFAKARALRSLGKYSVKPLYWTFQPLEGLERFMQAVRCAAMDIWTPKGGWLFSALVPSI